MLGQLGSSIQGHHAGCATVTAIFQTNDTLLLQCLLLLLYLYLLLLLPFCQGALEGLPLCLQQCRVLLTSRLHRAAALGRCLDDVAQCMQEATTIVGPMCAA
jgi:hypothetical protein